MPSTLNTLSTSTDATTVQRLTLEELPRCVPFAKDFHAEMRLPGAFKEQVFLKNWTTFLTTYPAVILTLRKGEALVGGIGGMIVPDLLDGRLCAHEFFWFVDSSHRTGTGAIRLLNRFEEWAAKEGAVEVRMVHLVGNHDEQLGRIYTKRQYKLQELCYWKALKGR